MRNILTVIQQMMEVIPRNNPLIADLEDIESSVRYAAPEMEGLWWRELSRIVGDHLPPTLEECNDWQRQVGLILLDRKS